MKRIGDIIRGIGSLLSAYLVLTIGPAIILHRPLFTGTGTMVVTILVIGPLSILIVLPAFVLSLKWDASLPKRLILTILNAIGMICSAMSIWWTFVLWRMGPINPG